MKTTRGIAVAALALALALAIVGINSATQPAVGANHLQPIIIIASATQPAGRPTPALALALAEPTTLAELPAELPAEPTALANLPAEPTALANLPAEPTALANLPAEPIILAELPAEPTALAELPAGQLLPLCAAGSTDPYCNLPILALDNAPAPAPAPATMTAAEHAYSNRRTR